MAVVNATPSAPPLPRAHARRLREMYRSAGWPCLDAIEVDLLAAGLLARVATPDGNGHLRDSLRVTDAGLAALAVALQRNRAAFDAHEALVAQVVRQMQRGGRTAFTGLSLRAALPTAEGEGLGEGDGAKRRWVLARPDVFSIRHTTVAAYLAPAVHEVKVRRADLLGELRPTPRAQAKRGAYLAMGSEMMPPRSAAARVAAPPRGLQSPWGGPAALSAGTCWGAMPRGARLAMPARYRWRLG